ncbi:hypothetical protein [Hahella sp. CCB-MM4]|uniref:hypothetical protein n=1 Tax=Hahella sp. (strain CCB-MM4) TaxID=1926491 RepID=UPI0011407EBC|nr:hypothetical protein [Hahella sp. CCB-MM4]
MSNDIYQPPTSDVTLDTPLKGSAVKGILFGALIDILGSLLLSIIVSFVLGIYLAMQKIPAEEIVNRLQHVGTTSFTGITTTGLGLLISALAGYVCARKSITNIYRNTTILSVISCSFGLIISYGAYSPIEFVVLSILTIGAMFLGTYLWHRKSRNA